MSFNEISFKEMNTFMPGVHLSRAPTPSKTVWSTLNRVLQISFPLFSGPQNVVRCQFNFENYGTIYSLTAVDGSQSICLI